MTHMVRTRHVQALIRNGLSLAEVCDDQPANMPVKLGPGGATPIEALAKAAADLRHAAEELEAERLSCLGWPQV